MSAFEGMWSEHSTKKEQIQEYLERSNAIMEEVVRTGTPHRLTHRFSIDPRFFNGYEGYCLCNSTFGPIPTKASLVAFLRRNRTGTISKNDWPKGCTVELPVAQWLHEIYTEQNYSNYSFALHHRVGCFGGEIRGVYLVSKVTPTEQKKRAKQFILSKTRPVAAFLEENEQTYLLARVHRALVSNFVE